VARPRSINRGEANPNARLREKDVKLIRRLRGVLTRPQMANTFQVKVSCIDSVLNGKNWSWLQS
jgi:hypothetical protein